MLVVDTGVLVAAADLSDPAHEPCAALLASPAGPIVTTGLVIAEASYLISRELGAGPEALLFQAIAQGEVHVADLVQSDWVRIHQLVEDYRDLPLGGTDASVIALAERLDQSTVATLDHRHFGVVRPAHRDSFDLLP
ncbi:MAG: PIN domain-containing protein [Acidimicrobiales bacterium]